MSFSNQMVIAIAEAQSAIPTDGTLVEKLQAAMHITRNHWMCTNEDEQFRAAIGAVMLHYGEGSDEFARLEREARDLNRLNALLSAARAGLSVSIDQIITEEDEYERIGLVQLWREDQ